MIAPARPNDDDEGVGECGHRENVGTGGGAHGCSIHGKHMTFVDAVNNATTEEQHRYAAGELHGFREGLRAAGVEPNLLACDIAQFRRGHRHRPMCCGVFSDWSPSDGTERDGRADSSDLVRPGDWLLIAVKMPADLEDSESCHKDLLAQDFLQNPGANWHVEVRGIERRPSAKAERVG